MNTAWSINSRDTGFFDNIEKYSSKPILVTAPVGYGLYEVCKQQLSKKPASIQFIYPSKNSKVEIENGSIGVEDIREIQISASHKLKKSKIICITKADAMTKSAQNAFLKLLEEPSLSTCFILCSERPENLLTTIKSRVQTFNLHPINRHSSIEIMIQNGIGDKKKQDQILFLAEGLPLKITKLSKDDDYFDRASLSIRNAMDVLSKNNYEKIVLINSFKEDRISAIELIENMLLIVKNSIFYNKESASIRKIDPLLKAKFRITSGGNVRLNLLSVVL